jgi:inhibitor of growth protein 3
MVACENPACPFQWFHLECVGLATGEAVECWLCPYCTELMRTTDRVCQAGRPGSDPE